jgi:hypothetical protein
MAPGGFVEHFLEKCPGGFVDAVTLPEEEGGHQVLIPLDEKNGRIQVSFADVTMFASEIGADSVPPDHHESQIEDAAPKSFSFLLPREPLLMR